MNYNTVSLPYIPGKVVVSGAAGANGFATLRKLRRLPEVRSLVALVISDKEEERVKTELRALEEQAAQHPEITPFITQDPEEGKYAQVWINWKGVNLATLKRINPNLEQEAAEKGLHLRDMLLEKNKAIALEDAGFALQYAPNCLYIQQGNPIDVLARSVMKLGFDPEQVISSGTLMEYYRFTKLFAREFLELSQTRATGLYIGEHGENAVPVRESLSVGGVPLEEYVRIRYGEEGMEKLEQIYSDVNNEAVWLRERMEKTPSEGPAAVTRDLVRMILNPEKKTIVGATRYIDGEYGMNDVSLSLPLILGNTRAEVLPMEFSDHVMDKLYEAYEHLRKVNTIADKL